MQEEEERRQKAEDAEMAGWTRPTEIETVQAVPPRPAADSTAVAQRTAGPLVN